MNTIQMINFNKTFEFNSHSYKLKRHDPPQISSLDPLQGLLHSELRAGVNIES